MNFEVNGILYNSTVNENGIANLGIDLCPGNYAVKLINRVTGDYYKLMHGEYIINSHYSGFNVSNNLTMAWD